MYAEGEGVGQDYVESVKWLRMAAHQGQAEAQSLLGTHYAEGVVVEIDYGAAFKWWEIAAAQGEVESQFGIGYLYINGYGVPKDLGKALEWFRRAAEQGHPGANLNIGLMYDKGEGLPQNHVEAAKRYRKAAESGFAEAQHMLGSLYGDGRGVSQDYEKAMNWWRKAAEQGIAEAQFNLGVAYERGNGVRQNYSEAGSWWRKAADQEFALAQYNLGLLYGHGRGVERDHELAANWWRKAAEQGLGQAQFNLGTMYELGIGVPQDDVESLMWYILAASQGLERAGSAKNRLRTRMPPQMVDKSYRMAADMGLSRDQSAVDATHSYEAGATQIYGELAGRARERNGQHPKLLSEFPASSPSIRESLLRRERLAIERANRFGSRELTITAPEFPDSYGPTGIVITDAVAETARERQRNEALRELTSVAPTRFLDSMRDNLAVNLYFQDAAATLDPFLIDMPRFYPNNEPGSGHLWFQAADTQKFMRAAHPVWQIEDRARSFLNKKSGATEQEVVAFIAESMRQDRVEFYRHRSSIRAVLWFGMAGFVGY
ncbi:MAG: sel1 repeat family protein [Phycisphaeraceae bacterium]|nr:MAG: sel1 repeat family protein [Phycisphaeraceae bacterium]